MSTTNSTIEIEYIVISESTKEVIQMKKIITDLRIISSIYDLISLLCDNNLTFMQAKELKSYHRLKHILIIAYNDVTVKIIPFEDNIIDILTKILS